MLLCALIYCLIGYLVATGYCYGGCFVLFVNLILFDCYLVHYEFCFGVFLIVGVRAFTLRIWFSCLCCVFTDMNALSIGLL